MSTIPDQLYDRLANACITTDDGAALIGLLEQIGASIPVAEAAADRRFGAMLHPWRLGAWSSVADQYRDLIGGGAR